MADHTATLSENAQDASHPQVRRITTADVRDALRKGVDDFWHKPSHIVFLCIIYPILALFFARLIFGYDVLPLLFPLTAGFALVGPVAALGLYELSRRRELGQEVAWRHAFDVVRRANFREVVKLALVLLALFLAWLVAAMVVYALTLGAAPESVGDFARQLFFTRAGWTLIVVGNAVGLLFAIVVLAISVTSFPMLVDRNVTAGTAVRTSLRVCARNPVPMAFWGVIVLAGLAVGSLPLFVGLAVVFPILGHATWHLYRKAVER